MKNPCATCLVFPLCKNRIHKIINNTVYINGTTVRKLQEECSQFSEFFNSIITNEPNVNTIGFFVRKIFNINYYDSLTATWIKPESYDISRYIYTSEKN